MEIQLCPVLQLQFQPMKEGEFLIEREFLVLVLDYRDQYSV